MRRVAAPLKIRHRDHAQLRKQPRVRRRRRAERSRGLGRIRSRARLSRRVLDRRQRGLRLVGVRSARASARSAHVRRRGQERLLSASKGGRCASASRRRRRYAQRSGVERRRAARGPAVRFRRGALLSASTTSTATRFCSARRSTISPHDLTGLRTEMTAAGLAPNVPIYLGEYNNDAGKEGKAIGLDRQRALRRADARHADESRSADARPAGSPTAAATRTATSPKSSTAGSTSAARRSSPTDLPNPYEGCANTPKIPGGTPFPTARVMALMAREIPGGPRSARSRSPRRCIASAPTVSRKATVTRLRSSTTRSSRSVSKRASPGRSKPASPRR